MSIISVSVSNYKSIKKCNININEINLLIGENGVGKTTLLEAISYFYDNLIYSKINPFVFDKNNLYSNEINISITYDLSRFIKIVNKHLNKGDISRFNSKSPIYQQYFNKIKGLELYCKSNNILVLELTQIKGKNIKWNLPYEIRNLINSLYPLYYIRPQNLIECNWAEIWNAMSDFGKLSKDEEAEIQEKIENSIYLEGSNVAATHAKILEMLKFAKINIVPDNNKEYATLILKTIFQGTKFKINDRNIDYYSQGTNAFVYFNLYINIISELSRVKLKEPLLLLDELELNLHHQYIDQIMNRINENINYMKLIISTHSPRLVKNVIRGDLNVYLYEVKIKSGYSFFAKIKLFRDSILKAKYHITDEHANAFFSKAILLVEGESEVELFTNRYLRSIFPFLENVDTYKCMANDILRNSIFSSKNKHIIPIITLVDLDKIISIDNNEVKFKRFLVKEFQQKEMSLYNSKKSFVRNEVYQNRRRIEGICKKSKFKEMSLFNSCNDPLYYILINTIKKYYENYNVFVNSTTLEGLLINTNSYEKIYNYLLDNSHPKDKIRVDNYFDTLNFRDQTNALRMLFNGKSDLLKNASSIPIVNAANIKLTKKTEWITGFLEVHFLNTLKSFGVLEPTYEKFKKEFYNNENFKEYVYTEFGLHFKEFNDLIRFVGSKI